MCLHLSAWEMRRWQEGHALSENISIKGVFWSLARRFLKKESKNERTKEVRSVCVWGGGGGGGFFFF